MSLIGVLLNRHALQRAVRHRPAFERLDLYVDAAKELGVDVIFFEPGGLRMKRGKVAGYVGREGGRFARQVAPIPFVIHKRGLFTSKTGRDVVTRLGKEGRIVFNPEVTWDKLRIHRLLVENPKIAGNLPETVALHGKRRHWFEQRLSEYGEVFVKPRRGSLGIGVARVVRLGNGRYRYESRRQSIVSDRAGAWGKTLRRPGNHLLQRGIPLFEDNGSRVDFRVPVQRDGDGQWRVAGMAAKRAEKPAFLTNLAQGSSVHVGRDVLARRFGAAGAGRIAAEIKALAIEVAETINAHYPRMVDLGLDIGVDIEGRPYFIEANRRDLRILFQRSGQLDAFRSLCKNPIAYACRLAASS